MRKRPWSKWGILISLAGGFMLAGCSQSRENESSEILLAAAARLKNVYEAELIPMFQQPYPQIKVRGTYDSSGKDVYKRQAQRLAGLGDGD